VKLRSAAEDVLIYIYFANQLLLSLNFHGVLYGLFCYTAIFCIFSKDFASPVIVNAIARFMVH